MGAIRLGDDPDYIPMDAVYLTVGEKDGEATHTLTLDKMPKHTHNANSLIYWGDNVQYLISSGNSNRRI